MAATSGERARRAPWRLAPGATRAADTVGSVASAKAAAVLRRRRASPMGLLAALALAAGAMPAIATGGRRAAEPPAAAGGRAPAATAESPSGRVLYLRFCASCHGVSGKGDGTLAPVLKTPPTDLTALARQNSGRLDEARLIAVIDGRRVVTAHGSREMPVWGAIFDEELTGQPYGKYTGLLRSQTLADYVRSIQER